jgi:hypothetical protein
VGTEAFLKSVKVAVPKTPVSEVRAKAGKSARTSGKAASRGVKAASRAAKAFGVALPVFVETGFFFYDEKKNHQAFERGEQTREETQCITYENVGRHGAALVLGMAGAGAGVAGGSKGGAAIGTWLAGPPGSTAVGAGVGAAVGGVAGGIVGGVAGEIGGGKAGEWAYVSKAEKGAQAGDPAAVFFLGGYHYKRIEPGKDKHVAEALEYLSRVQVTTNGGFPKANVFLGKMAWDGIGREGERNKAVVAVDRLLPSLGIGRKLDRKKAVELWRVAADFDDEDAMYLLARAALAGEGMGQDIEEGHEMMREAASRGCELAIDEYPETERLFRQWDAARQKRDAVLRMACRIGIGFLLAGAVLLAGVGFAIRKRPAA